MQRFQTAYRHDNGEVEGFVGYSFTSAAVAETFAIRQMKEKVEAISQTFDTARVITSAKGLSREELETIRADWESAR